GDTVLGDDDADAVPRDGDLDAGRVLGHDRRQPAAGGGGERQDPQAAGRQVRALEEVGAAPDPGHAAPADRVGDDLPGQVDGGGGVNGHELVGLAQEHGVVHSV